MYAIVNIAGQQFKVSKDKQIVTQLLDGEIGSQLDFNEVFLLSDKDNVKIGEPVVKGAKVQATIVAHDKAKKVVVFKKKRRKGYRVLRGHRQPHTILKIDDIVV
jgi:large subunit ribosomal protein L21